MTGEKGKGGIVSFFSSEAVSKAYRANFPKFYMQYKEVVMIQKVVFIIQWTTPKFSDIVQSLSLSSSFFMRCDWGKGVGWGISKFASSCKGAQKKMTKAGKCERGVETDARGLVSVLRRKASREFAVERSW